MAGIVKMKDSSNKYYANHRHLPVKCDMVSSIATQHEVLKIRQ